jgi:hypothetical protein
VIVFVGALPVASEVVEVVEAELEVEALADPVAAAHTTLARRSAASGARRPALAFRGGTDCRTLSMADNLAPAPADGQGLSRRGERRANGSRWSS